MAATTTAALFVTANVGSIFEDPSSMLKIWTEEFLATVSHSSPKMVALHCQEVGGKNYERSMQHVSDFVKLLMESEELRPFNKVRIYLDEDYSSAEHFTALGNFYFFHESIPDENVQIYDFQERKFVPVTDKEIHSGNIEAVSTKEKSKFPQEIFPECKWSRKGFMRTRWNLNGTVFDLVNIHLFHDASNFIAMESFPSVYCKNRQRALEHTLKRFHTDQYGIVPFFVFGDFNFRTDTQGVVKKLSEGLNAVRVQSNKNTDHTKLQYKDESSQVVLTLGKKEFSHQNHQKVFVGEESDWLKEFDRELDSFSGQLFEFTINFPPTYPYVEDSESGEMYMQTRCPSWCDRVFLSASAQALVKNIGEDTCAQYGLIGQNACMGDHKPVFLQAELVGGLGNAWKEDTTNTSVKLFQRNTNSATNPETSSGIDSIEDINMSDDSSPDNINQSSSDVSTHCLAADKCEKVVTNGNGISNESEPMDEELDEAAIIREHLAPVPFPEPLFEPAIISRYILLRQTECPIKVFKETAV